MLNTIIKSFNRVVDMVTDKATSTTSEPRLDLLTKVSSDVDFDIIMNAYSVRNRETQTIRYIERVVK